MNTETTTTTSINAQPYTHSGNYWAVFNPDGNSVYSFHATREEARTMRRWLVQQDSTRNFTVRKALVAALLSK